MSKFKALAISWVGGIVSVGGLISYFLYFARFPDLRDTPWLNTSIIVLGMIISLYGLKVLYSNGRAFFSTLLTALPFILGIASLGLLLWYSYILSATMPTPKSPPLVGTKAPIFSLPDQNGKELKLSDLLGKRVVLVFYRGFW